MAASGSEGTLATNETLEDLKAVEKSADIDVAKIKAVLARKPDDLWQPPNAHVSKAIEKCVAECVTEEGEEFVKGWLSVAHNSMGKEQERIIMCTSKAFYRVKFDFAKAAVDHHERTEWEKIQNVIYGSFRYTKSAIPSLGQFILAEDLNKLYGFRYFYKEQPPQPLSLPFMAEQYIDKCYRTFRPRIPQGLEGEAAMSFMQKVTMEVVLIMVSLMRMQGDPYWHPWADSPIDVYVTRGTVVVAHNKGKMGMAKDYAPASEEGEKKEGEGKEE